MRATFLGARQGTIWTEMRWQDTHQDGSPS
jgi:hypothetical protein